MGKRDKRSWQREDKQALVGGVHSQDRIMGNMRELTKRTNDRRSLELINDSYQEAERTYSGLSGIIRRLFSRE